MTLEHSCLHAQLSSCNSIPSNVLLFIYLVDVGINNNCCIKKILNAYNF